MPTFTTTVRYIVHYRYPWDNDVDSPSGIGDHELAWGEAKTNLGTGVTTDEEAQLASMGPQFRPKCNGPFSDVGYPYKIVKHTHEETDDGFKRDTEVEVPLPKAGHCPCGKTYWPIRGEQECHELVAK